MFLRELFESPETVGIIFGRFNPPHKGHKAAWEMASKCTHWFVGTNKSTVGPKDPLPFDVKIKAMETIWPEVSKHLVAETSWLTLASKIYQELGDKELICFTDEDWVTKTIIQYNGKEGPHGYYAFSSIKQQATPRLSSATALRDAVIKGDRNAFSQAAGVPADISVDGKPFFDLVAEYLLPYANAPKKAPAKKKPAMAAAEGLSVCRVCGQTPCNCTFISLKEHYKKTVLSESILNEMAMDSMVIPKYGKLLWLNDNGAHMIAKRELNGSLHIYALGTHQQIAAKWAQLKQKYLSTEGVVGGIAGAVAGAALTKSVSGATTGYSIGDALTGGDEKTDECAGVGIVNKQNSTADVGPGTLRKNLKAFHLTDDILEAAYTGNIGMMELFQFFSKADPKLVSRVKELIAQHKEREVWQIIQKFTGTRLVGKEFQ